MCRCCGGDGVGERVQLHKKLKFNHKVSETKVWKKLILFVITNQTERRKILEDTEEDKC